jgi:hypothetical protein
LSKRLIAMLAGVIAIAVIAAGCGSSNSSTSSGGTSSSSSGSSTSSGEAGGSSEAKAEFIKEAETICRESYASTNVEGQKFAIKNNINIKKPTKAQTEELIGKVLGPAVREQAKAISDLGAPSGEEAEVKAIVKAIKAGAEETEENPRTLMKQKDGGPFAKANELVEAYGLKGCRGP